MSKTKQKVPTDDIPVPSTEYKVEDPQPMPAAPPEKSDAPPAKRPRAVFVVHGMGQQIPFQTLDQVAEGLRKEDARRQHIKPSELPQGIARAVRVFGKGDEPIDERLQRVELTLGKKGDGQQEVHLYEGYWAPLTEGQVTIRDVISFLFTAALHGIQNGLKNGIFSRWIFGRERQFPAPARTVVYLMTAFAVVVSLVAMNATIVAVGAARSVFADPPRWLSDALLNDLTITFNFLLAFLVVFALSLVASKFVSCGFIGLLVRCASILFLIAALFAIILAGIAVPLLFHRLALGGHPAELWQSIPHAALIARIDEANVIIAVVLLLAGITFYLLASIYKVFSSSYREFRYKEKRWWLSLIVLVLFLGILALGAGEVSLITGSEPTGNFWGWTKWISWILLVPLSASIRVVLVQYVGDLAAYITPNNLDRFNDIRLKIKAVIRKQATAIYAARVPNDGFQYEQVAIVAHSLGSVIAYDTLNGLLNDDEFADPKTKLDVRERTNLLLTFGSPLDKTAFVFGLQQKETSEAREALAASVQPLIQDPKYRTFDWINIHSGWDIISGSLKFYDPPGDEGPKNGENNFKRIDNRKDPQAKTLLAAHNEYWENELIYKTLYDHLV